MGTLAVFAALAATATTTASAATFNYDGAVNSRVHVRGVTAADAKTAVLGHARDGAALPSVAARGASTTPLARNNATEAEERLGGACHSFAPGTLVVLADGSLKPIDKVAIGDKVRTANPVTGREVVRTVTELHRNHDRDLSDVIVRDSDGHTSVVHTTQLHKFWDQSTDGWQYAKDLASGDRLRVSWGIDSVQVVAIRSIAGLSWMYDLTVDQMHTYYVVIGDDPVLVHNCNGSLGRMTGDQQALKDLVDEASLGGRRALSQRDAETVLDWAAQTDYPGLRAKPGDVADPSNWDANPVPHIHIPGAGRGGHVPVVPGVEPRW